MQRSASVLTPQEFIAEWSDVTLEETAAYQGHFIDLCRMLGQPTPTGIAPIGTWLGAGNDPRHTPTTTFETFPFPWPPGQEPVDDPRVEAIAAAARELHCLRERWLNPEGASEAELKRRTLTNLYNQPPTWLVQAHARLDRAAWAAYAWDDPDPAAEDEETILARLLALNLARAGTGSNRH